MEGDKLVQLDPAEVLAEDNARWSLANVEQLAESVKEKGGVLEPVAVTLLKPAVNGQKYRLIYGFRRHAAVVMLNSQGAGLTLPAIVREAETGVDLLTSQLTENIQREDLSPMDIAVAIKQCFDNGMTKPQVRELFKRPVGKKGAMAPASNAWVNMMLSFLDLPKQIQTKIHAGIIGVAAAYAITKATPDKRLEIVKRAEDELERAAQAEARENERLEKEEAKAAEIEAKETEAVTALDHAKAEAELAEKLVAEKLEESAKLYKKARAAKGEDKKAADEAFKTVEKEAKAAENTLAKAKKDYAKLVESRDKLKSQAEASRKKLEDARKASAATKKTAQKKTIGATDVQKAAREAGEKVGRKVLTGAEMRKVVEDLSLEGSYPKVTAIGVAFKSCFDSVTTAGELYKALAAITGELTAQTSPASGKGKAKK